MSQRSEEEQACSTDHSANLINIHKKRQNGHIHGELCLVSGPPCAGKSLLTAKMAANHGHVDGDKWLTEEKEKQQIGQQQQQQQSMLTKRQKISSFNSTNDTGPFRSQEMSLHEKTRRIARRVGTGDSVIFSDNSLVGLARTRESLAKAVQKECAASPKGFFDLLRDEHGRGEYCVGDVDEQQACGVVDIICEPVGGIDQCWRAHYMALTANLLCDHSIRASVPGVRAEADDRCLRENDGDSHGSSGGAALDWHYRPTQAELGATLLDSWLERGALELPGGSAAVAAQAAHARVRPRQTVQLGLHAYCPPQGCHWDATHSSSKQVLTPSDVFQHTAVIIEAAAFSTSNLNALVYDLRCALSQAQQGMSGKTMGLSASGSSARATISSTTTARTPSVPPRSDEDNCDSARAQRTTSLCCPIFVCVVADEVADMPASVELFEGDDREREFARQREKMAALMRELGHHVLSDDAAEIIQFISLPYPPVSHVRSVDALGHRPTFRDALAVFTQFNFLDLTSCVALCASESCSSGIDGRARLSSNGISQSPFASACHRAGILSRRIISAQRASHLHQSGWSAQLACGFAGEPDAWRVRSSDRTATPAIRTLLPCSFGSAVRRPVVGHAIEWAYRDCDCKWARWALGAGLAPLELQVLQARCEIRSASPTRHVSMATSSRAAFRDPTTKQRRERVFPASFGVCSSLVEENTISGNEADEESRRTSDSHYFSHKQGDWHRQVHVSSKPEEETKNADVKPSIS